MGASTPVTLTWYVAPASLDRIQQLIRRNPSIKMELKDAKIEIRGKWMPAEQIRMPFYKRAG